MVFFMHARIFGDWGWRWGDLMSHSLPVHYIIKKLRSGNMHHFPSFRQVAQRTEVMGKTLFRNLLSKAEEESAKLDVGSNLTLSTVYSF